MNFNFLWKINSDKSNYSNSAIMFAKSENFFWLFMTFSFFESSKHDFVQQSKMVLVWTVFQYKIPQNSFNFSITNRNYSKTTITLPGISHFINAFYHVGHNFTPFRYNATMLLVPFKVNYTIYLEVHYKKIIFSISKIINIQTTYSCESWVHYTEHYSWFAFLGNP